MNDWHHLIICFEQKNSYRAMLLLRDKSEFAARKIMEKARITPPAYTGKLFWRWVQEYIFKACKSSPSQGDYENKCSTISTEPKYHPVAAGQAQPGCTGSDQTDGTYGHDSGPHQHPISTASLAGTVCDRQNGFSVISDDLGHECQPSPGKTTTPCEPAMDVGNSDSTRLCAGISGQHPVVRAEHSVCVRRRDTVAGLWLFVWPTGINRRDNSVGRSGLPVITGQLWSPGGDTGAGSGSVLFTATKRSETSICSGCFLCALYTQWERSSCRQTRRYPSLRCAADRPLTSAGRHACKPILLQRKPPLFASSVLLL